MVPVEGAVPSKGDRYCRERKAEASERECCAGKTSSFPWGQQGAGAGDGRSPGEGNEADLFVNPSENNRCLQASTRLYTLGIFP